MHLEEIAPLALNTKFSDEHNSLLEPLVLPFELESMKGAKRYRQWLMDTVTPFLGNRILELGAGIGNMSRLFPADKERIVLSEYDERFFNALQKEMNSFITDPRKLKFQKINLNQNWATEIQDENIDTIISFNVLEHIKDDAKALLEMAKVLRASQAKGPKRIIVVVPAHMWAYGELDRTFEHYRRYNKAMWKKLTTDLPDFKLQTQHMNLFGLPGWVLMSRILKKKSFGLSSVKTFEALCPFLRPIDDLLHKKCKLPLGQSIIAVLTLNG